MNITFLIKEDMILHRTIYMNISCLMCHKNYLSINKLSKFCISETQIKIFFSKIFSEHSGLKVFRNGGWKLSFLFICLSPPPHCLFCYINSIAKKSFTFNVYISQKIILSLLEKPKVIILFKLWKKYKLIHTLGVWLT